MFSTSAASAPPGRLRRIEAEQRRRDLWLPARRQARRPGRRGDPDQGPAGLGLLADRSRIEAAIGESDACAGLRCLSKGASPMPRASIGALPRPGVLRLRLEQGRRRRAVQARWRFGVQGEGNPGSASSRVGSQVEGCVADFDLGQLYAWARKTSESGNMRAKPGRRGLGPHPGLSGRRKRPRRRCAEGLTIYYASVSEEGYLIAAKPGEHDSFKVYELATARTPSSRPSTPSRGHLRRGCDRRDRRDQPSHVVPILSRVVRRPGREGPRRQAELQVLRLGGRRRRPASSRHVTPRASALIAPAGQAGGLLRRDPSKSWQSTNLGLISGSLEDRGGHRSQVLLPDPRVAGPLHPRRADRRLSLPAHGGERGSGPSHREGTCSVLWRRPITPA